MENRFHEQNNSVLCDSFVRVVLRVHLNHANLEWWFELAIIMSQCCRSWFCKIDWIVTNNDAAAAFSAEPEPKSTYKLKRIIKIIGKYRENVMNSNTITQ